MSCKYDTKYLVILDSLSDLFNNKIISLTNLALFDPHSLKTYFFY